MVLAMKVACGKEGDGDGGKSDGNKGGEQATATREMATEKANNNQPVTGLAKVGGGWQESMTRQPHDHNGGQQQTMRACGG
jgi:hypothetical protein